jgi:hypothetical protein
MRSTWPPVFLADAQPEGLCPRDQERAHGSTARSATKAMTSTVIVQISRTTLALIAAPVRRSFDGGREKHGRARRDERRS